ncbi:hypothetical protein DFP72DRAFT_1181422, partial [Ephemerocybe angulata]
ASRYPHHVHCWTCLSSSPSLAFDCCAYAPDDVHDHRRRRGRQAGVAHVRALVVVAPGAAVAVYHSARTCGQPTAYARTYAVVDAVLTVNHEYRCGHCACRCCTYTRVRVQGWCVCRRRAYGSIHGRYLIEILSLYTYL